MYEEMIKKARNRRVCVQDTGGLEEYAFFNEMAGAIEHLQSELRGCRNELCLKCGQYKTAHLGSCDDCRWRDI